VAGGLGYFLWPRPAGRPVVLIRSPGYGEQIEVDERVTLHAIARDERKVTRVELWVDGELQQAQSSALAEGVSPLPLVAYWQPLSPGTHTLIVRAFNAEGGRAHASINVEAIERADRDGDGVADEADACPDEPGSAFDGCTDRDGDGVADAADACADQAGLPTGSGCPTPGEGDRDGDGVPDEDDASPDEPGPPIAAGSPDADLDGVGDAEDACPTEAGWPHHAGCPTPGDSDGDGVPDAEDACPEEWGLPEHGGCSDDDGDGVRDVEDACLSEPGLPEHAGCPDRDSDGVSDDEDLRPDEPGRPESAGAPDTGAGDSDGDGVPDDADLAPEEPGFPEHGGAPPPGEGADADEDGIPDAEEPPERAIFNIIPGFSPGELLIPRELREKVRVPVMLELLEFRTSEVYDQLECYFFRDHRSVELYEFRTSGEHEWELLFLGVENSITFLVDEGEWLSFSLFCYGYRPFLGPEGRYDLGLYFQSLNSAWEELFYGEYSDHSIEGDEGHDFHIHYRICPGSCEEGALPQPHHVTLWRIVEDRLLTWIWEGDPESIDGFKVYVNGNYLFAVPKEERLAEMRRRPTCSEEWNIYMTAYAGDDPLRPDRESPPSDILGWGGEPCLRTVRVEFTALATGDLGDDEYYYDNVGPIYGEFWVAARSGYQELDFNAVDYPDWWGQRIRGYRLDHVSSYMIQDIFDEVWDWILGSWSSPYSVPRQNYVTVQAYKDDTITIGGRIMDADTGDNPNDTLFDESLDVLISDLMVPGTNVIEMVDVYGVVLYVEVGVIADYATGD
ncbi:MAG: thrombospondin type 3 repeat-containing protein, partial [Anaerolineae bacterium]